MLKHILLWFFLLNYVTLNAQLDIRTVIDKARKEIFEEKNEQAIERLNQVIKLKSDYFQAYFYRGIAKFGLSDYIGAIKDFTEVIRLNPFLPDAYHYRGVARNYLNDYNDALNDYDKAAQMDINNPGIFLSRGLTRISIKNYSAAIEDFNKVISLNSSIVDVYIYRAVAKAGLKEYDAAIKDCNMAISMNQFNNQAYIRRGLIQYELEKYNEAISDYNKALKIKPDDAYTYYVRALARFHLDDFEGTMADYNKVIELNPYNALAYYNRAMLKSQLGKTNESISDLSKVIELNPVHVLSYYNRGIWYGELKKYTEALADFNKAIELYPDFGEAFYMRSLTKRNLGQIKSAEIDFIIAKAKMDAQNNDTTIALVNAEKYRKVIELEADFNNNLVGGDRIYSVFSGIDPLPDYSLFMYTEKRNLTLFASIQDSDFEIFDSLYLHVDNRKDSLIIYSNIQDYTSKLLKNDQGNYLYWYIQGIADGNLQNYNSSLEAFTKSIELKPDFVFAWLSRAYFRLKMLDFINSIDEGMVINVNGKNKNVKSKQQESTVDYSQVMEDYNKAIDLNPDGAYSYFNRANLKLRLKNYDGALFDYNRAIKLEPEFADAYYNMALMLIYQQKFSLACAALSKAGELGQQKAYLVIQRYCKN